MYRFTCTISIGFLWFTQMRAVLRKYKWNNPTTFDWNEGPGWLDKTFYIRGNYHIVLELKERFEEWSSPMEPVHV